MEDITFTNNLIRNVADGINILGKDDIHTSQQTARVHVSNNLFENIGGQWGSGRAMQFLGGAHDVRIERNTVLNSGPILTAEGAPSRNVVIAGNILIHNDFGISGTGTGIGNATLEHYFRQLAFTDNVLVGAPPVNYPPDNAYPATIQRVRFTDPERGDFRLAVGSSYSNVDAGKYAGVDFARLCAAISVSEQPHYCE